MTTGITNQLINQSTISEIIIKAFEEKLPDPSIITG